MSRPDVATTLAVVEAGIAAVAEAIAAVGDPDAPTACSHWCAIDLARHVEAIAGAYLLWAGSAVGGRIARMRTGADLHRYNEVMLERLPRLSMAEHRRRYDALATDHVRLARATWSLPMVQTPDGTVLDVGRHAGIVAIEWHVHAWDLARAGGGDHVPTGAAPDVLVEAWDDVMAEVTGTERPAADRPWPSLLRACGRTP